MSCDLYRQTTIGDCLVEALEELMESKQVPEEVAISTCKHFDQVMLEALRTHVQAKAVIKANLKTYRYFDGVWQFNLSDVSFKLNTTGAGAMTNAPEVTCPKAKIICVDAALMQTEAPAAGS